MADVIMCPSGNYVLASVSLLEETVTVRSIYGKNEDDIGFCRYLFQVVHSTGSNELV